MADIENLNFEVILQDKNFRKRVEEDIRIAQDLNVKLSDALNFNKKVSIDPLKRVTAETKKMTAEMEKFNKAAGKDVTKRVKQLNTSLTQTSDIMRTISRLAGVTFGVEGVRRFLGSLVEITGEFEVQKMALTSMLQSADKADEIFNTLRQSALNSPYTFQDLTKYAKQLTAFNISADSLVETEKMLADVAAGLGVDMGRIILAYGQVKAAGVLKGTELRQFTEAGVPLLQSLAEQIQETEGHAISLSEVFQRITKKEIPFEMVEEAFRRMTSEGGKFYNMQEVLVNTLQGKIGKLRDVWQQALYDIGSSQDSALKGAVDTVTWLIQHMEWLGSVLIEVIKGFGAYAAVLLMVAARQKAMELGRFVAALLQTARGVKSLSAAFKALNLTAKSAAGAIGAIVTAGFLLFDLFRGLSEKSNAFNKELEEIHKNAGASGGYDTEIEKLRMLQDVMNDSTKSYAERNRALAEIKSIIPGYHAQLNEEGRIIKNNTTAVNEYIAALERSARQKKLDAELEQLLDLQDRSQAEVDEARAAANRADAARRTSYTGYGSITGAGDMVGALSESRAASANNRLKQAEENLKKVGDAITGVKDKMKDLLAEGFVLPNNDPTWTPLGDDKGQGIQKQIDALKEVQGYYETLKEFMSDEDIKTFFDSMGIKTNGFDFWTQILDLAKELEKVNPDAAARVFAEYNKFLVGNKVSDLKGKADAAQKWAETLRKWTKDWGGGDYHGIEGDIDKVIRDYNNEDEEITQDYIDSLNEIMEAHWGDADAINAEIAALDKLVAARRAANATEKQEKLNGLVKSIYGKQTSGLNLSEWAHKSGREIKEIISALGNVRIPKEIADMLDEKTLNALSDALEELASEDIEKALTKLNDNRLRNLQKAASVVSDIAGAMKEYAEASGNDTLASMADALSFIADTAGNVFNRLAQGDYAGAVLAVVGGIAKEIMGAATAAAQLNAALAEAVEKSRVLGMSSGLKEGVENLFGESGLRKIRNAAELAEKLRKTAYDGKGKFFYGRDAFFLPKWETMIGNLAAGVGGEVYDEYGNLNAETLKLILETYKKLDSESRQWIQHAIDDSEAYKAAMEQLDDVLRGVFGDVAAQAADKIVERWAAAGDAALEYGDILDDVATRYAKVITESMLIDSVLTPEFKAQLQTLFTNGDTEGAMALILGGMEQIQAMAPEIAQALEPLRPYIQADGSGTDPLKDGINKEMVEGNSSLIVSYMNAMRADVSVLRQLQTAGWADVRLVRETMPTLADHVARIEANTYDNAVAAQGILSKLSSIITPSTNGGSAVRTTK